MIEYGRLKYESPALQLSVMNCPALKYGNSPPSAGSRLIRQQSALHGVLPAITAFTKPGCSAFARRLTPYS